MITALYTSAIIYYYLPYARHKKNLLVNRDWGTREAPGATPRALSASKVVLGEFIKRGAAVPWSCV